MIPHDLSRARPFDIAGTVLLPGMPAVSERSGLRHSDMGPTGLWWSLEIGAEVWARRAAHGHAAGGG